MKPEATEACSEPTPGAVAVAEYLAGHPEFFNQHPELLSTLRLPHASGQAVSLWDRQIDRLRREIAELRAQQAEFVETARQNAGLMANIHQLVLALITTREPDAVVSLLGERLAKDFGAERVSLLVFADGTQPASVFTGTASPRQTPFSALLAQRATLCGRLTQAQRHALFGDDALEGSHVVLPLGDGRWQGLLVASSSDPLRFEPGMGTEFLAFLRDVVTRVLAPWVVVP